LARPAWHWSRFENRDFAAVFWVPDILVDFASSPAKTSAGRAAGQEFAREKRAFANGRLESHFFCPILAGSPLERLAILRAASPRNRPWSPLLDSGVDGRFSINLFLSSQRFAYPT